MTPELKPCPFCGGHLAPRFPGWFDHPKSKCILSGKAFPKGYIGQWNTRADIAAAMVAAEREACAALVEHIVAQAKKSMTPAQILLSRDEPKAVAEALMAIAAAIRNRGKS